MDLPLVVSHCPTNRPCSAWTNKSWRMWTLPCPDCWLVLALRFSKISKVQLKFIRFESNTSKQKRLKTVPSFCRRLLTTDYTTSYVRWILYLMRRALLVLRPFDIRTMDAGRQRAGQTSMDVDTWGRSCIGQLRMVYRLALDSPGVGRPECSKRSGIARLVMRIDWQCSCLYLASHWQNRMAARIVGPSPLAVWPLCLHTKFQPQVVRDGARSHDAVWNFCALRRSTNASCCAS